MQPKYLYNIQNCLVAIYMGLHAFHNIICSGKPYAFRNEYFALNIRIRENS